MKKQITLIALATCALFVGGLREQFCTANVEGAAGTHGGAWTRRADAATTNTHLLYKKGSDDNHVALCGVANYPLGVSNDQPEAAEDLINILPLGVGRPGSVKFRCATALADEIDLYTAANGLVQGEPGSAGTYWKVGRSVAAAQQVGTSDYIIEAVTQPPVKLTVAATPGTVGAIAAAFTTGPGLVKFL
jgi:hypothetical protein